MDCGTRNFASVAVELDGKEMRIVDFDLRDIGNTVRDWYANFYELVRRRFDALDQRMKQIEADVFSLQDLVERLTKRITVLESDDARSSSGRFSRFCSLVHGSTISL